MHAKTFADFFGNIDFTDATLFGDNFHSIVKPYAAKFKRTIDLAANYLNSLKRPGAAAVSTHNDEAERMAKELSLHAHLKPCRSCGKYDIPALRQCSHCGAAR